VAFVEAADVVNEAEATHFGANGFERSPAEAVFVYERFQGGQELIPRPFELDENREKDSLVVFVSRKKNWREFIKSFDPSDLVVIEVNLGACHLESQRRLGRLAERAGAVRNAGARSPSPAGEDASQRQFQ